VDGESGGGAGADEGLVLVDGCGDEGVVFS